MHARAFSDAVRESVLPGIFRHYSARALAEVLTKDWPDNTQAEAELLLAAIAATETGQQEKVRRRDQQAMFRAARRILDGSDSDYGPFMTALRNIRQLRPAWYLAPLYADLLRPFEAEVRDALGVSLQEVFQLAISIEDRNDVDVAAIPELLLNEVAASLTDIGTPGDLWAKCVIVFPEDKYYMLLSDKAVEAFYRGVLNILKKRIPRFGTRKGDALEAFVAERLTTFLPGWQIRQGREVAGREKDFICWDEDSGVGIECKSLHLRGSGRDWSARNLESDVADLHEALDQVRPSLEILRTGGRLDSGEAVPPREHVQGIVVTAEPYTAYARAAIDGLPFDVDLEVEDWHGTHVWAASFVDFHYILGVCQTPSVLLHYLASWRSRAVRRFDDETEFQVRATWCKTRRPLQGPEGRLGGAPNPATFGVRARMDCSASRHRAMGSLGSVPHGMSTG